MPALVNINVGSFFMTIGAEGTGVCPLLAKKSMYFCLISLAVIYNIVNFHKLQNYNFFWKNLYICRLSIRHNLCWRVCSVWLKKVEYINSIR